MEILDLPKSYSEVAGEYSERIFDELKDKPKDRELLSQFASQLGEGAKVCDLGCGPGQVTRFLHSKNLNAVGIDIAPGMIEQARRLNPDIDFRVGDMRALDVPNDFFDGVTAFYSLIHLSTDELPKAFAEIKRTLNPGGLFLFSFHIGDETVHLDEWWDYKVNLDFHFFQPSEIKKIAEDASFEIVQIVEREPYSEDVEHQSRRAYFTIKKSN